MIEIAGGILIAIAVLAALPFLLVGAYWAFFIGLGLAIVVAAWFGLEAVVGETWAWIISIAALIAFFARLEKSDSSENKN